MSVLPADGCRAEWMLEEESQTVWVTNLCLPGPEPFHTAVLLYTVHTPINSQHFNIYFPLPSHITIAFHPYCPRRITVNNKTVKVFTLLMDLLFTSFFHLLYICLSCEILPFFFCFFN